MVLTFLIISIIIVSRKQMEAMTTIKIKELRKRAGMNQTELAKAVGVTQGIVSMWENGLISPNSDKLPALAKALRCTIDDLF